MKPESINEVARAAPPVSVGGLTLWGFPLSEWVLILTAIYTLFLIIDKIPSVFFRLRTVYRKLKKE